MMACMGICKSSILPSIIFIMTLLMEGRSTGIICIHHNAIIINFFVISLSLPATSSITNSSPSMSLYKPTMENKFDLSTLQMHQYSSFSLTFPSKASRNYERQTCRNTSEGFIK